MRIDLDDLAECEHCHVIFNFKTTGTYEGCEFEEGEYTGKCPMCKKKFSEVF